MILIHYFIQANMENIRRLKLGLIKMEEAENITNFARALSVAFDLLEEVSVYLLE